MRKRREPWKWPLCFGVAVSLMLVVAFGLPRSWLGFLLPGGEGSELDQDPASEQWLILMPPPEWEVFEPRLEPAPPPHDHSAPKLHQDPRWWTARWTVAAQNDEALFTPLDAATEDTVRLLLAELGLGVDFMTRAQPDSMMAARLFLLQLEDSFLYDELKPFLHQVTRSRAYADILSRAADMYDEPLAQTIQVPD